MKSEGEDGLTVAQNEHPDAMPKKHKGTSKNSQSDTNVWISGLLWGGVPNQALQRVRQGQAQALVTEPLLNEIARTLAYPKLQPKLQQLQETPESLLLTVQEFNPALPTSPSDRTSHRRYDT